MFYCALAVFFAVLFFYSHNYFYLLLVVFSLYLLFKRNKKEVFILSGVILFLFSLLRFNYFNIARPEINENSFIVIEDNNSYVILENNKQKFIFYDDNNLKEGNKVEIEGEIVLLDFNNDFNEYLKKNRVYYQIIGNIKYNNNYVNTNIRIIDKLLENKDEYNSKILRLILFNQRDESNGQFYSYFAMFSLNFLIVISGFHINLLFKILEKTKIIKYIFVCFYLYLLNLSISSLKAFIYYVLKKITKKAELSFNNIDLLSLIFISMLFVNPSYCFDLGFIYTFVFSFSIDLINNVIAKNRFKNRIQKKFLIFLVSIPLILLNNYEINLLSFFLTLILEIPISLLFVFSLLYLFFDKFYLIYKLYVFILEYCLANLSKLPMNLVFGKPSYLIVIFLYLSLLLFLYLYQNKFKKLSTLSICVYFLILTFQYHIPIIDSREIVYFLDVGQGDCSVLKIKNSKSVVLIDTGGSKYKDIAAKTIIPFLKQRGINSIEKVIITHDDFDHKGALESLLINFNVEEVIDNSKIENIVIGNTIFTNLNVSDDRNNDGSIVLYGKYGGIKYLFTGDISKDVEMKLLEKYELDVDVLKVSHHGSSDSSDEKFIESIKPIISLIGVSKNNIYNHPSTFVMETLEKVGSRVYRTDLDGDIMIYNSKLFNKIIIEKEKNKIIEKNKSK